MVAAVATVDEVARSLTAPAKVLKFRAKPKGKAAGLPPEYQYDEIYQDGNIVGATIPWLESPEDGVIRSGQIWKVKDDGLHAKPLSDTEQIRFLAGTTIPIVVIGGHTSMCLELFLREVLKEDFAYDRG